MARQAEAERERRAKVINADGEFQAAARLAEARGDDVDVPFGIEARPVLDTRLEKPEILELPDELAARARTRAERLEVDLQGAGPLDVSRPGPGAGRRAPLGQHGEM